MDVTDEPVDELGTPAPDLTPRAPTTKKKGRGRNPFVYGFLALIVVAIGFVVFQGLNNAALYYRNADEAIRDQASLGTREFRVQGTVQNDVARVGNEVDFTIQFPADQPPSSANTIKVHHVGGDPPELFKAGLPVVLDGKWSQDGSFFVSSQILVKHSESYKAANPDRVSSDAP
jgi:cytochrome c-type biogenesis protein CcmE